MAIRKPGLVCVFRSGGDSFRMSGSLVEHLPAAQDGSPGIRAKTHDLKEVYDAYEEFLRVKYLRKGRAPIFNADVLEVARSPVVETPGWTLVGTVASDISSDRVWRLLEHLALYIIRTVGLGVHALNGDVLHITFMNEYRQYTWGGTGSMPEFDLIQEKLMEHESAWKEAVLGKK